MSVTIKLRGNTEAYWQSANPTPADREVILSTDKLNFKVGDGATAWVDLEYWPKFQTEIYVSSLDSPRLVLEQIAGTWPAQKWSVVGQDYNWYVWNMTTGKYPLRVASSALTNALFINSSGAGFKKFNPNSAVDIVGEIQLKEMTAPSSPATDHIRIYAKDNGAGKTQLCIKFSDGTETVLATQP